jgi:uncharacterized protein
MAKPTGAVCNLDCEYCFFLSKELLYEGSRFRMAEDLLETYVRQLMDAHARAPEVAVAWQGGEPTIMGVDFFRRVVEFERAHARPGQRVSNALQTNATLIDDDWGAFLHDNDFLVGVSIDGPRELHDCYRVDKGGKPTFDRVIMGLERLKAHNVEWNSLTCVHAANGDHGVVVYRFLRDELGARFMQFIPVVERMRDGGEETRASAGPLYRQDGTGVTRRSVGPAQFGRFLVDVFEEWVRRDVGTVFVQMFDTALAHWAGEPGGICVHEETCGLQVALEHNGDVYSCDHFVEPSFRLGNIKQDHLLQLVSSQRQKKFGLDKRDTLTTTCRKCEVRFACNGGCPKDRFAISPSGEPGHNYLCASYATFFRHVDAPMQFMAGRLAAQRPPAEVTTLYSAADRTRARNEPCTCGGGRKWKQCHGR